MRTANCQALTRTRQHGAALLVMLVILITGGAYLLVSQLNRGSGRIEADRQTSEALAKAKEALIGWAVGYGDATGNATTPGMLPYPDRRNDGQYDGMSDCPLVVTLPSAGLLLGKIPRIGLESPCVAPWTALGLDVVDGAGEVLWYAVSRNMVSALGVAPVINPGIMDNPPPFPWLVVRDQNGNPISSRVAFVLIAPGPALPGQNRFVPSPPTLPPMPTQFLEAIGAVSNADFDGALDIGPPCASGMCEDFVMSEPWPSATASTFNDRLLYVTIDELMPLIEQRVAREVRQALNGVVPFPSAAAIGYIGDSCTVGSTEGFLPLRSCECRRIGNDISCDCLFDPIAPTSITYTASGSYTPPATGLCSITPTVTSCSCTGAGSCSGPTGTFQCNAEGTCAAHNTMVPTPFTVAYTLPASVAAGFSSATAPNCTTISPIPGPTMSCSNIMQAQGIVGGIVGGCSPMQLLAGLPDWFLTSGWKHYIYYAVNPPVPPFLTVGGNGGVNAVVISAGSRLAGQARPSSLPGNYLENPNGVVPAAFAGVGQPLTNTFNDQTVIVSP